MREAYIPGLNNRYKILETGDVIDTLDNSTVPLIHSSRFPGRYPAVSLATGVPKQNTNKRAYKHTTYKVHRLMAELFIPNPEGKRTVNHIDGNPQNNKLSNLEWATYSENAQHAYTHNGRRRKTSSTTEDTKNIVLQALREYGNAEVSVAEISSAVELPYSAVRYSIVRLIEEGKLQKNTLYTSNSKYARFSYTVLDTAARL